MTDLFSIFSQVQNRWFKYIGISFGTTLFKSFIAYGLFNIDNQQTSR